MTDELREGLQSAAGIGGGSAPDVVDLWRAGRRRRAARRALTSAAMVVAVVLVGAIVTSTVRRDDAETVRTAATQQTCRPRSVTASESMFAFIPPQAPRTPAAMVHGGGSEHLRKPTAVARVKVLSTEEVSSPNELMLLPEPPPEVRARVEVTDSVFGVEVGDRFTISDLGTKAQLAELAGLKKTLMVQIDDFQRDIDRLNRPLEELDGVIARTDPNAANYSDLLDQRTDLKETTDADRNAAQGMLADYQQRLQVVQVSERLASSSSATPAGTSCHRLQAGDDLVVAVVRIGRTGPYELTGSSSFFVVDGNGFSDDLDAARRSVPGWSDSELLRLARTSTVDEFLDRLRQAADN